jgi:small multidrug resistance family-3 protein
MFELAEEGRSRLAAGPCCGSLVLFVWLLTLHPTAAGRVYAAYGGVYVARAIMWLWVVHAIRPTPWDWLGVAVTLTGWPSSCSRRAMPNNPSR